MEISNIEQISDASIIAASIGSRRESSMKDYRGTCWNCGRNFTKSRTDQMFCSNKCRRKYNYIPVPHCKGCVNECEFRNEKRKYAPRECPIR